MQLFHELVIDDWVGDTSVRAVPGFWDAVIGSLEDVRIIAVVDRVTGTSPTFLLFVNESPDLTVPHAGNLATPLFNVPLTVGQSNLLQAALTGATPGSYGSHIWFQLGGTGAPSAHVRIWATGRGRP